MAAPPTPFIRANRGFSTGTDTVNADIEPLPDLDSFDSWCDERDLREDHSVARRYVSDDVIGYEDLDDYGGWRPVPEYGTVWFPHVSVVGWAPYRFGHWAWVSPWGWTWVDDAPWGFAPFHYGRWVFVGGGWGWVPCPPPVVAVAYVRPVYAPALVAWVGGPHFAAGIALWRRVCCRGECGLVPTRATRSVRAFVSGEPDVRQQREHLEHDRESDGDQQLLQHDHREQKCHRQ